MGEKALYELAAAAERELGAEPPPPQPAHSHEQDLERMAAILADLEALQEAWTEPAQAGAVHEDMPASLHGGDLELLRVQLQRSELAVLETVESLMLASRPECGT